MNIDVFVSLLFFLASHQIPLGKLLWPIMEPNLIVSSLIILAGRRRRELLKAPWRQRLKCALLKWNETLLSSSFFISFESESCARSRGRGCVTAGEGLEWGFTLFTFHQCRRFQGLSGRRMLTCR